jgi:hypothetical protein
MVMSRLFIVCSLLLATGAPAHAGQASTSGIYGGTSQLNAICYVRNTGAATINSLTVQILDQNGGDVTDQNNCASPLPANKTCSVVAFSIVSNHYHLCKATIVGSTKNIRASLDVRDSSSTILRWDELR